MWVPSPLELCEGSPSMWRVLVSPRGRGSVSQGIHINIIALQFGAISRLRADGSGSRIGTTRIPPAIANPTPL